MNMWYITSAFNYLLGNTHSRGTCRRRGISWTGSIDTGSCSAGSQDTSRLASSGIRFASGYSVGKNPEDRSRILEISGRFGVIAVHTGGSGDDIWNNKTEEVKENWEIYKIRKCQVSVGAREQLPNLFWRYPDQNPVGAQNDTLRRSSLPIPTNINTVSITRQFSSLSYELNTLICYNVMLRRDICWQPH
jgi:hypothetical protein